MRLPIGLVFVLLPRVTLKVPVSLVPATTKLLEQKVPPPHSGTNMVSGDELRRFASPWIRDPNINQRKHRDTCCCLIVQNLQKGLRRPKGYKDKRPCGGAWVHIMQLVPFWLCSFSWGSHKEEHHNRMVSFLHKVCATKRGHVHHESQAHDHAHP